MSREGLRAREVSVDEGNKLLRIVRRSSGSVVTWRRAQMVLLSVHRSRARPATILGAVTLGAVTLSAFGHPKVRGAILLPAVEGAPRLGRRVRAG